MSDLWSDRWPRGPYRAWRVIWRRAEHRWPTIEISVRDRFLNVITDPNVAYVLMMLGMLGFLELANPA